MEEEIEFPPKARSVPVLADLFVGLRKLGKKAIGKFQKLSSNMPLLETIPEKFTELRNIFPVIPVEEKYVDISDAPQVIYMSEELPKTSPTLAMMLSGVINKYRGPLIGLAAILGVAAIGAIIYFATRKYKEIKAAETKKDKKELIAQSANEFVRAMANKYPNVKTRPDIIKSITIGAQNSFNSAKDKDDLALRLAKLEEQLKGAFGGYYLAGLKLGRGVFSPVRL